MKAILPLAVVIALGLAGTAQAAVCTYLEADQRPTRTGAGVPLPAAGQADWYGKGEAIVLFGDRYEAFGPPLEVSEFEFGGFVKAGEWKGVPLFTEASGEGEVMYLPVDPKTCSFQRYAVKD